MQNKIFAVLTLLTLLTLFAGASGAAANAPGKANFNSCVACHGAQAEGSQVMNAPRLNHLEAVYIVAQLEKFKSGVRGGQDATVNAKIMAGMVATLPNEQAIRDVADYIVTLQGPGSAASVEGDAELGGDYYNQFCGACHGAGAVGNVALNAPRLAGGDDWYLKAQLEAYRGGVRGAHPDDRTGKQMRMMAALLPGDQAIKDVVAYLRTLDN